VKVKAAGAAFSTIATERLREACGNQSPDLASRINRVVIDTDHRIRAI
jgi:hypothetical protein